MVVDERTRLLLPRILSFVMAATVIGAAYGYATSVADHAGLRGLVRGAFTGALIAAVVTSLRIFVLEAPDSRLVRASFPVSVAVRALLYLAIFLAAIAVGQFLLPNHPPARPERALVLRHRTLSPSPGRGARLPHDGHEGLDRRRRTAGRGRLPSAAQPPGHRPQPADRAARRPDLPLCRRRADRHL